jgi:hypothetical protein
VIVGQDLKLQVLDPITGASYLWEGPNGFNSQLLNPVLKNVTTAATGSYTVTTTVDGCTGASITIVIVYEPQDTGVFKLYPNPNKGTFTIKGYTFKDQDVPIEVVNTLGQRVYIENATTTNKLLDRTITIPASSSGVYRLRMVSDGKTKVIPFTVGY